MSVQEKQQIFFYIYFFFIFSSFAYTTIKDRLPGILTKVIDQFSRLASDYHNNNELVCSNCNYFRS